MKSWARRLWSIALDGEHVAIVHATSEDEALAQAMEQLGVSDETRLSVTALDTPGDD